MSSSFFEWQRQARKQTYVLSLLLVVMIAVISFALTYCLLPFIYLFLRLAFWEAFGFVLIVVSVVILGGTYSRYSGLWKKGAHTIALKLGAKPLDYPRTLLEQWTAWAKCSTCSLERVSGVLRTCHHTPSLHGGVVREPLKR